MYAASQVLAIQSGRKQFSIDSSHLTTSTSSTLEMPYSGQTAHHATRQYRYRLSQPDGASLPRPGFLMECAASPYRRIDREATVLNDSEDEEEARRISDSVLKSLEDGYEADSSDLSVEQTYTDLTPKSLTIPQPGQPGMKPAGLFCRSNDKSFLHGLTAGKVMTASREAQSVPSVAPASAKPDDSKPPQQLDRAATYSAIPGQYFVSQADRSVHDGVGFHAMCSHIWKYNDQRTSLYLQERLKCCIPGEFEDLVSAIFDNVVPLMTHRFGNFLVQCMLQLARPEDIAAFAAILRGNYAKYSKDPFCCHVVQRLLDVTLLEVQATIAAELLEDIVDTMTSPSGSHVWQKLLHIGWDEGIPPIAMLANNAVHREPNQEGWLAITKTEAGCATIKSFLGITSAVAERQECLNELLNALDQMILDPVGHVLAVRLAMITISRPRALALIFAKAIEYARDPIASGALISLVHSKIPGFASRLSNALEPFRSELCKLAHGDALLSVLDAFSGRRQ